jgi:hypothetical protein
MKNNQTSINWSEASEIVKQSNIKQSKEDQDGAERIQEAKDEIYNKMGNENFRLDDFESTCLDFDIDQDDLFYALI